MLASVVRRQSGGLVAALTPYLRSSAAATSRGFAAAAEEQVCFFSMAIQQTTPIRGAFFPSRDNARLPSKPTQAESIVCFLREDNKGGKGKRPQLL